MNTDNFKENIKINEQDKINQVYLEEVETDRTFNNKNNKRFLSRVDTQIEILKDKLKQSASILEVGCNNGELLYKIKKEFKNLSIFGSDTEIFKKFYRKSGINFISSTNQNKISRLKFDVIIFSQSIYYFLPHKFYDNFLADRVYE